LTVTVERVAGRVLTPHALESNYRLHLAGDADCNEGTRASGVCFARGACTCALLVQPDHGRDDCPDPLRSADENVSIPDPF
jgi:hypothetical protein